MPGDDGPNRRSRRQVLASVGALGVAGAFGGSLSEALGPDARQSAGSAALSLVPRDEATHRAVADGAWSDPSTWADDAVPEDGARVHVPSDATVTLDGVSEANLATVRVDGTLRADPAVETALRVETIVVPRGGTLELGTAEQPVTAGATVTFVDAGPLDGPPEEAPVERGLLAMGTVRAHGAPLDTFLPTAAGPREGDDAIELAAAPTGWSVGDEVVLAGIAPDRDEDERRTVTAIDGATVRIDEPLLYDHVPPEPDLAVHVANLERSVRLASDVTERRRRGHTMFMSPDVDLRYVGAYDLGRTDKRRAFTDPANGPAPKDVEPNPKARYAIHFHRVGTAPDANAARVRGCLVHGSPGWGVVNHGSTVVVEDSVTYDVVGAGFVTERGDEQGAFRRNFALRSEGSGLRVDSRQFLEAAEPGADPPPDRADVDDFGHGGHGFWFQGPGVAVEENVAAGHRHYAFVYWNRALPDRPVAPSQIRSVVGVDPNYDVGHLDDQPSLAHSDRVEDGRVPSSFVTIRSFRDNTAYASAGGMEVSRHQFTYSHDRREEYSVIDGFTVHSVGPLYSKWDSRVEGAGQLGLKFRYTANVRLENCRLLGTDKRGVGIERNHALTGLPMENCEVRDWDVGVRVPDRGPSHVRNCTLDNATDLEVRGGRTHHWTLPQQLRVVDTEFGGATGTAIDYAIDLEDNHWGALSPHSWVALDGRTVFAPEQAPSVEPYPDEDALSAAEGSDGLDDLAASDVESVDADDLAGRTNVELFDDLGLAVRGRPTPSSARRDERVPDCRVAAGTPTELFLDAGDPDARDRSSAGGFESVSGSGSGALTAVGDAEEYPPSSGIVTYRFEVPAGEYALWARTIAPSRDADSLWLHVDDREWTKWNRMPLGRSWSWSRLRDADDRYEPVTLALDAGPHEVTVGPRESGVELDALYLTDSARRPFGPPERHR